MRPEIRHHGDLHKHREKHHPEVDLSNRLTNALEAARNSADEQSIENKIVLDADAYRLLYFAAVNAGNFLVETHREQGGTAIPEENDFFMITRYKMEDGTVLDTDKAVRRWAEKTYFNGRNHISVVMRSHWDHETLYQSAKGRYYIVRSSTYQGVEPKARFVDMKEAAAWLLVNDHELPAELADLEAEITE